MENVGFSEYTAIQLEDNQHWVVMNPEGVEVIDMSEYGKFEATSTADTLNSTREVICWSYSNEKTGSVILSELYAKGYRLISHNSVVYDGTIINDVILHKDDKKQLVPKPFVYGQLPASGDSGNAH